MFLLCDSAIPGYLADETIGWIETTLAARRMAGTRRGRDTAAALTTHYRVLP